MYDRQSSDVLNLRRLRYIPQVHEPRCTCPATTTICMLISLPPKTKYLHPPNQNFKRFSHGASPQMGGPRTYPRTSDPYCKDSQERASRFWNLTWTLLERRFMGAHRIPRCIQRTLLFVLLASALRALEQLGPRSPARGSCLGSRLRRLPWLKYLARVVGLSREGHPGSGPHIYRNSHI